MTSPDPTKAESDVSRRVTDFVSSLLATIAAQAKEVSDLRDLQREHIAERRADGELIGTLRGQLAEGKTE